jgi:hypothetical protein
VLAAQHELSKHIAVGTLAARLAFVLTDFRLQGRTLSQLIISLNRHRPAWSSRLTLSSIYMLISRTCGMGRWHAPRSLPCVPDVWLPEQALLGAA